MLNLLVADDEKLEIERILKLIRRWAFISDTEIRVETFESGESLLNYCMIEEKLDIVLLDIQMQGIDGVQVAKKIREFNQECVIMFITSYWDSVFESFKVSAFRYILKDKLSLALPEALDSAMKFIQNREIYFTYEIQKREHKILCRNIMYFESSGRIINMFIRENGEKRSFYSKLADIEKEIKSKWFIRCHQSYMVNMKYVKLMKDNELVFVDGSRVPISKKYKGSVANAMLWLER